jgi:hypothetical protein
MEPKFIIIKQTDSGKRFLMHIGHSHQWTSDRALAMEYSKIEVAMALADKMGGKLEVI